MTEIVYALPIVRGKEDSIAKRRTSWRALAGMNMGPR